MYLPGLPVRKFPKTYWGAITFIFYLFVSLVFNYLYLNQPGYNKYLILWMVRYIRIAYSMRMLRVPGIYDSMIAD